MAADQQPQPEQQPEAEQPLLGVDTSGSTGKRSMLRRLRSKKLVLISVILVIALLLLGALYLFKHKDSNSLGSFGSYNVTESEVAKYNSDLRDVNKKQVVEALLDIQMYRKIGEEKKINVSEQDVKDFYHAAGQRSDLNKQSFLFISYERAVWQQKLNEAVNQTVRGRVIIARFDYAIDDGIASQSDEETSRTQAQRALFERQARNYADQFIQTTYKNLKSGIIQFDQAILLERSDTTLGADVSPTLLHSGPFDSSKDGSVDVFLRQPDIKAAVDKLAVGEFSEPLLATIPTSNQGNIPGYWVIVQVDNRQPSIPGVTTVDDLINTYKKKYNYEIR